MPAGGRDLGSGVTRRCRVPEGWGELGKASGPVSGAELAGDRSALAGVHRGDKEDKGRAQLRTGRRH